MKGHGMAIKKGFMLVLLMVFMIAMAITSIGIYQFVYLTSKLTSISETENMIGYYADMAAVRYIMMLVQNPTVDTTIGNVVNNAGGDPVAQSMSGDYPFLYTGLGLKRDVTITVRNNNVLTNAENKGYTITATYDY